MSTDADIEKEIKAKGLTAARVTPERIEEVISHENYFIAADAIEAGGYAVPVYSPLRRLTFCVLVLSNGFTVTGESACASPENFDEQVGRKVARANAVQKIWALEGYALRERISQRVGK